MNDEETFRARIEGLDIPSEAKGVIDYELSRLSKFERRSSDYEERVEYLDWLTSIPWGKCTEDTSDIKSARLILDEDHYGMEETKNRILEFMAVNQFKGTTQGKILCFHGPTGVGKTSIAKSIARVLNREFYRFSVGGMRDVAEIKGHRRTYTGAKPGRLVECLKRTKSENPLVLVDEIDKLGKSHSGDPASALLELFDPGQNSTFMDHYLGVPLDMSKVLFLCTANDVNRIPEPLRDRMELIEVRAYRADEKLVIADKYLVPASREAAGLSEENISISEDALKELISKHCRESGIRNLQRHLDKIMRRTVLEIVEGKQVKTEITEENLQDYFDEPENFENVKDETDSMSVKSNSSDFDCPTDENLSILEYIFRESIKFVTSALHFRLG